MTRVNGSSAEVILRGEFEATVSAIQSDVSDIKGGMRWALALLVTTLIGMVATLWHEVNPGNQSVQLQATSAYAAEKHLPK